MQGVSRGQMLKIYSYPTSDTKIVSRAVSMMLHFMYSELNALKRSQDGFCNYLFIRAEA